MEPHTDNVASGQEEYVADGAASSAAPRRRRSRGAWLLTGAGALVLLVAGGLVGVAIGRATAPGPDIVVLPGPVVQESPAAQSLSGDPERTADHLVVGARVAALPSIFTAAPGLSDIATTASGYRLSRTGLDGETVARGLAEVFGVSGGVVRSSDGWTVGSDLNKPTLSVNDDAAMDWTFVDPGAQAAAAHGVAVTSDRAKQTAAAVLAGLGVDLDAVDWQVKRYDDHLAVDAAQLVDGLRTSLSWQVNFGQSDAIVSASGFAAELVEVPGYDVIGAATAVRRAGLPTWSAIGPTPVGDASASVVSSASTKPHPSGGPSNLPTLTLDVNSVVVVDAVLGLGQFRQPDGSLLVLPAYRLTGDDGSQWTLIAVSGAYVSFVDTAGTSRPAT